MINPLTSLRFFVLIIVLLILFPFMDQNFHPKIDKKLGFGLELLSLFIFLIFFIHIILLIELLDFQCTIGFRCRLLY